MLANGKDAVGGVGYERHRPEQTLLYQIVEAHYPTLIDQLGLQGKSLPNHVHREFEAYLKCGRLKHGFLRVRCDTCHFERLVAFSCKKRGFCRGRLAPAVAPAGWPRPPPCWPMRCFPMFRFVSGLSASPFHCATCLLATPRRGARCLASFTEPYRPT